MRSRIGQVAKDRGFDFLDKLKSEPSRGKWISPILEEKL